MRISTRWALAATLAMLACNATIAGIPEVPTLRHIDVADGLPSSNVNGMAFDADGYLWLATVDGLARYDGVGVQVWQHVPGDPDSLPGNYMTVLHVDPQGRVWVAPESRGLSVLDPDRKGFRHYRKADHPQMGSDDVWAIASHDGAIWFGTFGGGLHRLHQGGGKDRGDDVITRYMPRDGDPRSLPSDIVLSLGVDRDDQLWVGTTAGLARWTGHDFERVALPGGATAPAIFSVTPVGDSLWVGASSGVFRRASDGSWHRPPWSAMFENPNAVFSVVAEPGGELWLASQRQLWRVAPGGIPQPVQIGARGPVLPMYQILRQANGAMWFPVPGVGLGYLQPDWRRIAQFNRERDGLSADIYRDVAIAAAGGVWLLGARSELERLDADGNVVGIDPAIADRIGKLLSMAVLEDGDGGVWIGRRSGLVRVDVASGRVRHWGRHSATDRPLDGAATLLAQGPSGDLWVSFTGAGLQRRDATTGKVLAEILPGPSQGLGVGDIEALAFDRQGRLWIADGRGMRRWDAAAGRFVAAAGIGINDRVFAFAFDREDGLWLQHLSGIEHYRRQGDRWRRVARVGAAQGVPSIEGAGMEIDAAGRIWLSSLRGLFRWDPASRQLRRFGLSDGLGSQEFIDGALVMNEAGVLSATLADGGVVLVDTRASDPPPTRPTLRIDRVEVRRQARWMPIDTRAPMHLAPDDREMRVDLRLLAFDDPQGNRYFTRLDGYDSDWIDQGANSERVFAGLPPGDYTLRARAVDAAGNAAAEQVLDFQVLPPWWRTTPARAGFAALLALLSWWAADAWRARLRRRQALQLAQHEHEVAREASLAKTRFLATLGHEVRTPMTGVLGMSELLLDTALDPRQRGYTESIRGAGEHLLQLVNDALDLARIEAGKLELSQRPLDLHVLVAEVAALMAPLAEARGLRFVAEVDPGVPRGVVGDVVRLRQILLNLLGNAIKFTEQGAVTLGVGLAPADGICLRVADTGPGLSAEQQGRLFRRFEQADGERTAARYGGSGLGLAICQELAAAMGGTIGVDSTPGAGTSFDVCLPLTAIDLSPVAAPAPIATAGGPLSVLLVEDDPLVAEVVSGLLRAQGHQLVHAAHGLAALAALATARFDVALFDLDLPGMDGFALARHVRAEGIDVRLVALTARADSGAESEATAAGFDRFLRKPVTGKLLQAMLAGVVEAEA